MKYPKLISICQTLTSEDWSSLRKHISIITDLESDLFVLFNYLNKNKTSLPDMYSVESFAPKLFPKSTTKAVSNYMSTLLSHVEDWLIKQQLEKEPYSKELLLLKALNEKGVYNLANQHYYKVLKHMEDLHSLNPDVLLYKHFMIHSMCFSNNPLKYDYQGSMLEDVVSTFYNYCKVHLMLYKIEMHNWGRIKKHNFNEAFSKVDKLIGNLGSETDTHVITILEKLVKDFDKDSFDQLKALLLNKQLEHAGELHTLATYYLISVSSKLWRMGQLEDLNSIKQLYEYGLTSRILTSHGQISIIGFLNIIIQVASLYSFEETKDFIQKWKELVNKEDREAAILLANAFNCFHHELYDSILDFVLKFNFKNLENKLQASSLHLIASFINRKEEPEQYATVLHNFKLTLIRAKPKLSDLLYYSYINFIDFIKRIDTDAPGSIVIQNYSALSYRNWCTKILNSVKNIKL